MAKKIYVGNMNYNTTEQELENLFGQYGTVASANIIIDRYTDRSKGFGFVEMEDEQAADAAISALDNSEFSGRNLKVNVAKERRPRFYETIKKREAPLTQLHRRQIELLRHTRSADQVDAETTEKLLRVVNAIASGLRTTG